MNAAENHLFVVALLVHPGGNHPRRAEIAWAMLRIWLRAISSDAALDRAREIIAATDCQWTLATRKCQVNVAAQWRGRIPSAAHNLTTPAQIVIEEEPAPAGSECPDFENVFRADPLLTRNF